MALENGKRYVYLDWAATAPLCEEAANAMAPFLVPGIANIDKGMNANSLHTPGRAAFTELEMARRKIACCVGATRPSEIIFTSGATEADNAAIIGIAQGALEAKCKREGSSFQGKVIVSAIEHDAVLEPAKRLERRGFKVERLAPDKQGFVSIEALEEVLDETCLLVSIQMANSEVGSIQPIKELAKAAHGHGALFHTDATQAFGKIPFDVLDLGIDAASFSAHKIGGPKGVGALYLKARTPFVPELLGGGQESGLRSGTQNVCGVVGFAAACQAAISDISTEAQRQRSLRDLLYEKLASFESVKITVPIKSGDERYLPNIVHIIVEGFESETMILRLDSSGYGVSGGSACSSHSLEPSHVLKALGVSNDDAYGALRISIGRYTELNDVLGFIDAFEKCFC